MAVRHGYGKIAGADALVFAYDTGDTRNSYRGEPTTNLLNTVNIGSFTIESGATRTATGNTYLGFPTYNIATNPTEVFRSVYTNFTNVGTGTYVASIWYRNNGTSAVSQDIYFGGANRGTGGGSIPADGQWHRRVVIVTNPSDTTFEPRPYTLVEAAAPQVEYKSHATPFINGTRSATQGLLDLTGNSTIDLSNVSFDSNAQMTFDGSNDTVTAVFTGFNSAYYSLEWIINPDTNTDYNQAMGLGNSTLVEWGTFLVHSSAGGGLYCGTDVATRFTPTNLPAIYSNGQYVHCTFTFNNGSAAFYKNGALVASRSMNLSAQSTFDRIFMSTNLDGYLPVAKVYNRVLTAAEVRNNYNQYKGRFNI